MKMSGRIYKAGRITPWETVTGAHCIGCSVGPRAALDAVEMIIIFFPLPYYAYYIFLICLSV
jgi:hypothetical protein